MDADEATFHYIDEYSRMAETYDRHVRPRFEPIARRLIEVLAPTAGERVLEIGAGTGNATLTLAERVGPSGLVAAIDAAEGQLRVLQQRAAEAGLGNIHQESMDAGHILYPRNSFDAATSNLGFPLLRWRQAVAETFRVLRDGGRFVFSGWDGIADWVGACAEAQKPHLVSAPSPRLLELREAVQVLRSCTERDELSTPATVEQGLEKAGFTAVHTIHETIRPGFEGVGEFLAFRCAWGYEEMEWREMPPSSQAAFTADLKTSFLERYGGFEALEFRLYFIAARRE
jgi:O-methyltransferase/aklanonic acid methyltransferase